MRKVFLDELPKYKNKIDWKNCIGYRVKFIYDDIEGEIELLDYYKTGYIHIKYNNELSSIKTNYLLHCELARLVGKYSLEYKYQLGDIIKTKTGKIKILEQIRMSAGKYGKKGYKYECLIDGNIDLISEADLKIGAGCNVCYNHKVLKGVNDLWTTHQEVAKMLKYKENGYKIISGSEKSEIFICPDCGYEKKHKLVDITRFGFSCPRCRDGISYPNKFAFNLLEQLHIDFIPEYSPDWIKPKRYDFYFELNNKKYILEMDGSLGHGNKNTLSGQTAEETKEIDDYKDEMAKEYNIEVIRIDCLKSELEYIKNNILNGKLINIFNLSQINWLKCHEFALSNRVKEACDLWNKGFKNTIKISNIMKMSFATIINYLKIGEKLGWCDYDPNEQKNVKVVQLSLEGEFIKEYNSILETNFGNTNISACCRGIRNSANGYMWMYKDDYELNKNNIKPYEKQKYNEVQIVQLSLEEEFIKKWDSIHKASRELDIGAPDIVSCCKKKKYCKTAGGFKWMYYEEWELLIKTKVC